MREYCDNVKRAPRRWTRTVHEPGRPQAANPEAPARLLASGGGSGASAAAAGRQRTLEVAVMLEDGRPDWDRGQANLAGVVDRHVKGHGPPGGIRLEVFLDRDHA